MGSVQGFVKGSDRNDPGCLHSSGWHRDRRLVDRGSGARGTHRSFSVEGQQPPSHCCGGGRGLDCFSLVATQLGHLSLAACLTRGTKNEEHEAPAAVSAGITSWGPAISFSTANVRRAVSVQLNACARASPRSRICERDWAEPPTSSNARAISSSS